MLTRRLMRRAAALAAVAAIALVGCSSGSGADNSGDDKAGYGDAREQLIKRVAVPDRDAAPDLSGKTLDGEDLALDDYKGKIVVVNIWGSWCSPCRGEAPALQKMSVELAPQGVEFLGINNADASVDNAKGFERKFGITYPSLSDASSSLLQKFDGPLSLRGLPGTYIVDRQGRVAAYLKGAVDETLLRSMINPVLGEG